MSKKENMCPKCGSIMQQTILSGDIIHACTCGHGMTSQQKPKTHGVVSYTQGLGGRKTLTRHSESSN